VSISLQSQVKLHRWVVWLLARRITSQLHIKNYIISGSYRRKKWWCNDIDLLISVASQEEAEGIKHRLNQLGWKKRNTFFRENLFGHLVFKQMGNKSVALDIFFVTPGCMGNALLFTTGPTSFNDKIRHDILSMGYSWSVPPHFVEIKTSTPLCF